MTIQEITIRPAGGQQAPAHNPPPPLPGPADDTDALLAVAQQAADAGLLPADLIPELEGLGVLSLADAMQARIADALAAGPAADLALDAIAPGFLPGDVVQITAICPAGGGALSRCRDLSVPEERAALRDFITQWNGRRNLYFGVNPRRAGLAGTTQEAKASDVTARRTVFVDMDLKDAPPNDPGWTQARAALEALGPCLLVETGNGFHAHFKVENIEGAALADSVGLLAGALSALGSDNVSDLPRIARLPWTVNLPNGRKRRRGAVPALAIPVAPASPPSAARSVADLCAALRDVATRLSLPGRGGAPGTGGTSSAARTGDKTGWPAPSAALLRMAMDELPNDGPFDDRSKWMGIAHAVKGAARAGGCEAEGHAAWLAWCARWHKGGNPSEDATAWDSIHDPHAGWGYLMRELEKHNPAGARRVKAAMAQAAFPPLPATFGLRPVQPFAAAALPPRRRLYGRHYTAGYLSMVAAPGGVGKSALTMVEAVAMASGRELLPGADDKPHHPMRVWYHNAEDDLEELRRRLAAVLSHHGLTHTDLGDRLFLTSGRDLSVTLAYQGRDGPVVNRDAVERLIEEIRQAGIEVLILDPLGAMHGLPENSNEAANLLMGALREIAERTGAAINLVHHTGKVAARDMDAAGAGAARGASALVDAARSVRTIRRMTDKEAKRFGIPEADRWRYIRADNAKANLAPAGAARWFRLVSVPLNNGTPDYPSGDAVQTVETWTPQVATATANAATVWAAWRALSEADVADRRVDLKSAGWVGYRLAEALGLDVGTPGKPGDQLLPEQTRDRATIQALIAAGLRDGWIVRDNEYVPGNQRRAPVYAAGKAPPEPADETDAEGDDADGAE